MITNKLDQIVKTELSTSLNNAKFFFQTAAGDCSLELCPPITIANC